MDAAEKVFRFYERWRGEKSICGRSVFGIPLLCLRVGEGRPVLIAQYAIHAREWVTSLLALEHIMRGVPHGSVYFLPMANPDGVLLSLRGTRFLRERRADEAETLLRLNGGSSDFTLWKANGRGVDLNVNFQADWGCGAANVRRPGPENYIGPAPFSEPETRALRDLTLALSPDATISFHTKGGEIYWEYGQEDEALRRDRAAAEKLAASAGYKAVQIAGSAGGYKDWCIAARKIPAFTVEAGSDALSHPIGEDCLFSLVHECGDMVRLLSEIMYHAG